MLGIFYADCSGLEADCGAYPISEYRRAKLDRISNAQVYTQSLGAELLLNAALHRVAPDMTIPLEIVCAENKKPFLSGAGLQFNLSHSGDMVLCAVSDSPVGVDVQQSTCFNEALSRRFFTHEEHEILLREKDRDYAFTRLWSLKESYLKMLGMGLNRGLDSFCIDFKDDGEPYVPDDNSCHLWHELIDGYHFALSFEAREIIIKLQKIQLP